MIIDTEKNQRFLALVYSLQNNYSNAVSSPDFKARQILDKEVYRAYDYNKNVYIYSLEQIQDMPKCSVENIQMERNKGGRPKILKDAQKQKIIEWRDMGISKRKIARSLGVSDWTVRDFLKNVEM